MDRVLLVLLALLAATLLAFFAGIFPYPIGLLVLTIFITARLLHLRSQDRDNRP